MFGRRRIVESGARWAASVFRVAVVQTDAADLNVAVAGDESVSPTAAAGAVARRYAYHRLSAALVRASKSA